MKLDPSIVDRARERVETWIREASVADYYAHGWRGALARPAESLQAFLVDPSEYARALRQVSPFAGVLSPTERWKLWALESASDDPTTA